MNLPFMCQVVANQISEASGLLEILSLLSLWYTLAVLEPISCLCFLSITPKNIKKNHRLSHIFNWYKKGILGRKGFRATDFLAQLYFSKIDGQKQPPDVLYKKLFLKVSQYSQENTCAEFCEFFKNTFFTRTPPDDCL